MVMESVLEKVDFRYSGVLKGREADGSGPGPGALGAVGTLARGAGARLGVEASPDGLCSRAWDPAGAEAEAVLQFHCRQTGPSLVGGTVQDCQPLCVFFHRYRDAITWPNCLQHRAVR